MVICKYFQNDSCRFGTKCLNEHIDIKPIIKTEVEAALKGSQWPLSCFGPFKEKPCIPNFIEDQSFEEVRYLCYEARKQNCFPAFHQQFTQQVLGAQNKMKTLLTLNREVIEVVTNLYNNADTSKKTAQQGNPFSKVVPPSVQPQRKGFATQERNSLGGQGLFGSGFTNTQGLFGQNPNTFNQSGGSIFSMGGQQQQQQQQQQQSSIFGSQAQPSPFANSAGFGSTPQSSLFNQPQQQQQSVSGGNLFTQQTPQSTSGFGLFGQPQQVQSVVQQNSPFGMQQQPTPTAGLFSQQQMQPNQNTFGLSQQNIFGQVPVSSQSNQQQNAFGVQPQNTLFGMPQQQQQQNLTAFSNTQQIGIQPQNTLTASNFGVLQQPQQQTSNNLFGQMQQQNAFQQQSVGMGAGGFPGQNLQMSFGDIPISENLYSKMDSLKPEEIEAFKADRFQIGKIPTNPPPRELIQ